MPMTIPNHSRAQPDRKSPRAAKGETRRRLLGHAKQLFGTRGYQLTTLEDVARAAAVPRAVLNRHFADKTAFLTALLDEMRLLTLVYWQALPVALADPLARLEAVLDAFQNTVRAQAFEMRLLTRLLTEEIDGVTNVLIRAYFDECASFLADLLRAARRVGLVRRKPDAKVAAWRILQAVVADALLGSLFETAEPTTRTVDVLLHGILKTDV